MFSVDLDHLNILIMLILAFFSFRAYHTDTLAIEYQPEEEKVEAEKKESDHSILEREQEHVESSEMSSQSVENVQTTENTSTAEVIEVCSENQIEVENGNSENSQSDLSFGQNKLIEVNTVEGSFEKIDDESVVVNSTQALEKDEDQESTLMNKISSGFSQEPCDQEGNVECSSSDDSSGSSQGVYPESSSDEEKGESRREKRKQIQKAKRIMKKNLRREQHRMQSQVEVIEIQ